MSAHVSTVIEGDGKFQVVMLLDSDKSRGVRAIKINRSTGEAHSLAAASGYSVAWRKFKNSPEQKGGGTFQLITVQDTPERGLRSMLVDVSTGKCWWHETDADGNEIWTAVGEMAD